MKDAAPAWTPERDARLLDMRARAVTWREVADALGVHVDRAKDRFRWLGGRRSARKSTAVEIAERRNLTLRACLCCGEKFASEGPHHRMCGPCRNGEDIDARAERRASTAWLFDGREPAVSFAP